MWNGDFVADSLNIEVPTDQPELKALLGMALRKNKKRAHLLVSTVLGKHIPVAPETAISSANIMADEIVSKASGTQKFTVFGYAETATCLGAAVAHRLSETHDVIYLHSTRYPVAGSTEYGSFEESHSHATSHHITPIDAQMLDNPERSIVLVDDEVTTGSTIMNTIRLLESRAHHAEYFIATLTDMRTEESQKKFVEFEKEMGITVQVVSLLATHLVIPEGSVEKAEPIIEHLKGLRESGGKLNGVVSGSMHSYNVPSLTLGLLSDGFAALTLTASAVASEIALERHERVLVLGLEEDMFFPMLVANELNKQGVTVDFSSTTRSPVITYDDPSYAINSRVRYHVEDDAEPRYAYNIHKEDYAKVMLITNEAELIRSKQLVDKLTGEFDEVYVALMTGEEVKLSEPLTGEQGFSSYSGADVQWLLKDISGADLEAPLEEREEAVQAGTSHYSESLPVEYLPTVEYQQLFVESLQMNKSKIAEAVGIVAEKIHEIRDGRPVLVSLARGGTPVGALIRRYLKNAYNVEVPHYAVSIVRGRGIDFNALKYLASNYEPEQIIFVDGWTGKGAISNELQKSVSEFFGLTGISFSSELAVLADPGSCTKIYGTREDYLIPSACLNSTVSGLVSRTVIHADFIGENDYHGAKFYEDFAEQDMSNLFLDEISAEFTSDLIAFCSALNASRRVEMPTWSGWKVVDSLKTEFDIPSLNLIKPGVGETTRVLLRRVPWAVLINPSKVEHLQHILMLAKERNVKIIERDDLPYSCVGIIKTSN
jgi:hypoxanthine phosphoribosyltransferase